MPADAIYSCACALSLGSAVAQREAAPQAAHAVDLIRQAVAKGYADIPHLLTDPDLAPLRHRPDYAALLWDIADAPAK